eukprot:CAMPEP_0119326418 /NCGR_PEP_ID=MMETSP1333-20130426/68355_1 /TAXON_ID=418940 /ORGANISM="Scyphosphaera apsteinii, Strain RCC1455" /LENGTH=48 /DNA_ID= /DNA_START= /DNA_END= /DNA_ORIENTATION=
MAAANKSYSTSWGASKPQAEGAAQEGGVEVEDISTENMYHFKTWASNK